jgi:hypothetical protein
LSSFAERQSRPSIAIPPQGPVYNAWYADDVVRVVVANPRIAVMNLRVGAGIRDTAEKMYSTQDVNLAGKTLTVVSFPRLEQTTPQGDLHPSDYVFLSAVGEGQQPGRRFQPIQNAYPAAYQASFENFIVTHSAPALFRFSLQQQDALRLIFIPEKVKLADGSLCTGTVAPGWRQPLTRSALDKLDIPVSYRDQVMGQFRDHFCFVTRNDEAGRLSVQYDIPKVKDCANITIPVYLYIFEAGGAVLAGGGHGATCTVYNPDTMKIAFPGQKLLRGDKGETAGRQSVAPR